MRRTLSILSVCTVLGGLSAQGLQLVDRVPAPLAYVAVAPRTDAGDAKRDPSGPSGLDALLDDPTIAHLLASGEVHADAGAPGPDGDSPFGVLRRLRDLLVLSTGELELVLNGLLPRADAPALPLLLARVRLSEEGRDRLESALSDPTVATPGRAVGTVGHRVYELNSVSRRRPGSLFEVCLVGRDLLVTNHSTAIEEVLRTALRVGPVTGGGRVEESPSAGGVAVSFAARHPESLAADPRFAALRARLEVGAGATFVHVDWRRLRGRTVAGLEDGTSLLLQGVGLLAADRIALAMRRIDGAVITSVVVDQPAGADGLLAVALPAPVRKLIQELPGHGLASVAFSIDPRRLHELAGRGTFHARLVGGCRRFGVDLEGLVVPQLDGSGTCRLVLLQDDGPDSAVAFSLRTRSARAARSLVDAFRDSLTERKVPVELRGRGDREVVVTDGSSGAASFGAVGDTVVFGLHSDVVERVSALEREHRRARQKSLASTQQLIEQLIDARELDAKSAVGVLEVDGRALAPTTGRAATRTASGRHAGLILMDGDAIRIELISPL